VKKTSRIKEKEVFRHTLSASSDTKKERKGQRADMSFVMEGFVLLEKGQRMENRKKKGYRCELSTERGEGEK